MINTFMEEHRIFKVRNAFFYKERNLVETLTSEISVLSGYTTCNDELLPVPSHGETLQQ